MGFIYVLTDDDKPSKIKVGRSTCSQQQLHCQYLRASPRARIHLWLECPDEAAAESKIKEYFRDYRQTTVNGGLSEWIEGVPIEAVIARVRDICAATGKIVECSTPAVVLPVVPPPQGDPVANTALQQLALFSQTNPAMFSRLCSMNFGIKNIVLMGRFPHTAEFIVSDRVQRAFSNIDEAAAFVGAGDENIVYFSSVELYCVLGTDDIGVSFPFSFAKNMYEYRPITHFTKVSKGFGFFCVCPDKGDIKNVHQLAAQFFATNAHISGNQIVTFVRVTSDADYAAKLSKFASFVRQRLGKNNICVHAPPIRSIQQETYYEFMLSLDEGLCLNPSQSRNPQSKNSHYHGEIETIRANPPTEGESTASYEIRVSDCIYRHVVLNELGYDVITNGKNRRWYRRIQ